MLNNDRNTEDKEKCSSKKNIKSEISYWIKTLAIIFVVVFVIHSFIFTVVRVDGRSMEPTFQNNDRLIIWRFNYEPQAGDIVVFSLPTDDNDFWIKRIIATEGQHVKIDYTTSSAYVDSKKIDEPYLDKPMLDYENTPITEIIVPEDCVFVLGDNRNNSTDSRVIGPVNEDRLLGKAVLRFWPFTEIETY